MSHVEFPGLGWSFDINSTAFSIGSFEIKWYGLLIATGFLLAVIYAMVMCKKMNINRSRLLDTIIVGLIAGVIGARLYYVIFYPGDKFIKDPISIFYIHEGGLGKMCIRDRCYIVPNAMHYMKTGQLVLIVMSRLQNQSPEIWFY